MSGVFNAHLHVRERIEALAFFRFLDDFFHRIDREDVQFAPLALDGIVHDAFEHICFDQNRLAVGHLDAVGAFREIVQRLDIRVELIVEATFQPPALAAQFGLVDGNILVTRRRGRDRFEIRQPGRAAKLAPAGADAAEAGRFLPRTDLAHLDFYPKFFCKKADQLPEIDAALRRVIKGRFPRIGLKFDIAHFHVHPQRAADRAGLDHRRLVELADFGVAFHVAVVGLSDDAVEPKILPDTLLFHLQFDQLARQRNASDIEAAAGVDYHPIARRDAGPGRVFVKILPRAVFETDLDHVERNRVGNAHRGDPVISVSFVAAAGSAAAAGTTFRRALVFCFAIWFCDPAGTA